MEISTASTSEISSDLLDAVRTFPAVREVEHCGQRFTVSSLALYAICPACGTQLKVRAFSAHSDVADLFDCFLEWMNHTDNSKIATERMIELADDD